MFEGAVAGWAHEAVAGVIMTNSGTEDDIHVKLFSRGNDPFLIHGTIIVVVSLRNCVVERVDVPATIYTGEERDKGVVEEL